MHLATVKVDDVITAMQLKTIFIYLFILFNTLFHRGKLIFLQKKLYFDEILQKKGTLTAKERFQMLSSVKNKSPKKSCLITLAVIYDITCRSHTVDQSREELRFKPAVKIGPISLRNQNSEMRFSTITAWNCIGIACKCEIICHRCIPLIECLCNFVGLR